MANDNITQEADDENRHYGVNVDKTPDKNAKILNILISVDRN